MTYSSSGGSQFQQRLLVNKNLVSAGANNYETLYTNAFGAPTTTRMSGHVKFTASGYTGLSIGLSVNRILNSIDLDSSLIGFSSFVSGLASSDILNVGADNYVGPGWETSSDRSAMGSPDTFSYSLNLNGAIIPPGYFLQVVVYSALAPSSFTAKGFIDILTESAS